MTLFKPAMGMLSLLVIGFVSGQTYKIGIPLTPVLNEKTGLKQLQLLKEVAAPTTNIEFSTVSGWVHFDAPAATSGFNNCLTQLTNVSTTPVDFCLMLGTPASFAEIYKPSGNRLPLLVTVNAMDVEPVVISSKSGNLNAKTATTLPDALYFLKAFRTSVWSLILLAAAITGALFFGFESTHPFQYRRHIKFKLNPEASGLLDSFVCVFSVMLMRSPPKFPKSPAAKVLILFWFAFTLICIITYLIAVVDLLLRDQKVATTPPLTPPVSKYSCFQGSSVCEATLNTLSRQVTQNVDFNSLADKETNMKILKLADGEGFVTDQVTGAYLRQFSTENLHVEVEPLKNALNLPIVFVTDSAAKIQKMNVIIANARQKARKASPLNEVQKNSALVDTIVNVSIAPVGIEYMNGPFVFIIIGGFMALLTHIIEFIFNTCLKKDIYVRVT